MYRAIGHIFETSTFLSFLNLLLVFLFVLFRKKVMKAPKIILHSLCTIPAIVCFIHFFAYNLHYANNESLFIFTTMYISSIFIFFIQFFYSNKKLYYIWIVPTIIISFTAFTETYFKTILKENLHNLTYYNYTDSFTTSLKILKKEYALNEHKKIDYDSLYTKYYPRIKKAEEKNDAELFYKTMYELSYEIKDAHFNFYINIKTEEDYDKYRFIQDYENKDYGFASVLLTDGTLSAIMVDEESDAYALGLRDGMTITKKDGIPVYDLIDEVLAPIDKYPVLEDERLVKSLWLFSTGPEVIELSFLNDFGVEKTIQVETAKEENIKYRANEYYHKLFSYPYDQDNLTTKMVNDTTGYLYVSHEVYDNYAGALAYVTNDSSYLTTILETKLLELKRNGMKNLIIDLRGNSGGYNTESVAIASLFTNDSYLFTKNAKYQHKLYDKTYMKGLGTYADLPITVLVDLNTVSAGDALAYALSKNSNVKIMGLTNSNNSCQAVGGYIYLTNGESYITYPTYNFYYPNGAIFIDPDASRTPSVKLDYRIPLTKESILTIMNTEEDYVLDYALKTIK